jgi:hypothetical protein
MASRARSDDVELCQYCAAVVEHTEDESAGGDTASSMDPVEDDAHTSRAWASVAAHRRGGMPQSRGWGTAGAAGGIFGEGRGEDENLCVRVGQRRSCGRGRLRQGVLASLRIPRLEVGFTNWEGL